MGWFNPASVAIIVAASLPLAQQIAKDTSKAEKVDVIELDQERYRRLTVPVSIGEHGPFNFMIDTGAQATVLSTQLADSLGIEDRAPASLIGMASRMPIQVAPVDNLTLGTRIFNIQMAALVDKDNLGSADGILGLDSLQNQRVLLDFQKKTIAVADADDLGGNTGYEIVVKARKQLGQLVITDALVDGIKTAVIVDTGAQGSIGNMALLEKMRGRDSGTTELTDINGEQLGGNIRVVQRLRMGQLRLNRFPVVFADSPPFHTLGLGDQPALVLGVNELQLFRRVAIDFKSRRILFDLPRDAIIGDPMRRSYGI